MFGVRDLTEMKIRCINVMYMLKVVSSEKTIGPYKVKFLVSANELATSVPVQAIEQCYVTLLILSWWVEGFLGIVHLLSQISYVSSNFTCFLKFHKCLYT